MEKCIDDYNRSLKYHRKIDSETNLEFAMLCTSEN